MPRPVERLSDIKIKQAKADPGKNRVLLDGGGLRLVITPESQKHFEFKSAAGGRERTTRLGRYPDLSLIKAREEAGRLRQLSKEGRNPVAEKQVERIRARVQAGTTFEMIAEELLSAKQKNVSTSYYKRMRSAITSNLFSTIGSLPIQDIDAPILREALRRIEARGSLDMLGDVRRWASEIFDLAKANGQYKDDNPADALLRNVFKKHDGTNMRALDWRDMPQFWQGLDSAPGDKATIAAIKLIVLTGCRPGEVRAARWEEFDTERNRWSIPADRMKMRKPHIVPLSRQAQVVLQKLKVLTGHSEYLFPARNRGGKSPVISDMALLKAAKRLTGKDIHVHGFRSVFSTYVAESGLWSDNVKEAALAHLKRGVEGAYDRATHYEQRVKLMQWYADEIDAAVRGAEVIPITGKVA